MRETTHTRKRLFPAPIAMCFVPLRSSSCSLQREKQQLAPDKTYDPLVPSELAGVPFKWPDRAAALTRPELARLRGSVLIGRAKFAHIFLENAHTQTHDITGEAALEQCRVGKWLSF